MLSNEAIRQQVETLLSQMTLEEKAAQMVQVPYTVVGREEALRWAKLGAGSFLHVLATTRARCSRRRSIAVWASPCCSALTPSTGMG